MHLFSASTPRFLISLIVSLALASCQAFQSEDTTITLFAASSLTDAFQDLTEEFQRQHPELSFRTNFASSAQLAIQITQGANADIFASADERQMQLVTEHSDPVSEPVVFATNSLVILVPAENPAGVKSVPDLAEPGTELLLANPGTPLRSYSDQVLSLLSERHQDGEIIRQRIMANVVSEEENARQVVAKIALGEADAAFAYRSDAESDLASDSLVIPLPRDLQIEARYPIVLIQNASQGEWGSRFLNFVLSPEGQKILHKWGFGPGDPLDG